MNKVKGKCNDLISSPFERFAYIGKTSFMKRGKPSVGELTVNRSYLLPMTSVGAVHWRHRWRGYVTSRYFRRRTLNRFHVSPVFVHCFTLDIPIAVISPCQCYHWRRIFFVMIFHRVIFRYRFRLTWKYKDGLYIV